MVGIPSLAIAASVLFVFSLNSYQGCLAFLQQRYIPSKHSSYNRKSFVEMAGEYHGSSDESPPLNVLAQTTTELVADNDHDCKVEDIYSDDDAFESLQNYVESISNNDSKRIFTCQLVPANSALLEDIGRIGNSTIIEINTIIFRPIETGENNIHDVTSAIYAVAIVPSSEKIDVRYFSEELLRLQQQNNSNDHYYKQWELAPSNIVRDLCGFEPGTIPPLLVPPSDEKEEAQKKRRRPFATIVDSSLLWNNNTQQLLLLGGGGNISHRCLIDVNFLIEGVLEIDVLNGARKKRNTKIASIIRFEGGMNRSTSIHPSLERSQSIGYPYTYSETETKKKPFFQIAPPLNSIVGGSSVSSRRQQQPHRPIPVTAIGKITSVRQIAKRLVFADFVPPDYNYDQYKKYYTSQQNETSIPDPPWKSGEDGKDMYVQIIVGKTFCERYEDGISRLKSLKPGKLVLVRGAANIDPMQKNGWQNSVGNWAQKRSLDVIVSSFEILEDDDNDDSLRMLVEEARKEVASRGNANTWNSLLPWDRKLKFERRAVEGSAMTNTIVEKKNQSPSNNDDSTTNYLKLDQFNSLLQDNPLKIKIVDTEESIQAMANDISELFSRIENQTSNILDYVAGIDCEWRPTGAYCAEEEEGPDGNPVALLQICLPMIGKVYLVDTHRTLRANLADTEEMTESEEILSRAIGTMFGSIHMIKVGYNVVIDFRRLAASFPHVPSFQNTIRSVVELSTLAQWLHPKSARPLIGSLQKLTKLVLGYDITKEQQCSNWEARPLIPSQIEYATLDCALPPRLLDEMAEGCGNARIQDVLSSIMSSYRFQVIDGSRRKDAIRRLKATRAIGNTFVITQKWLSSKNVAAEPNPTTIPEEGGGSYTDTDGILRMPADLVRIGSSGEEPSWKAMAGKVVGRKKGSCINLLVGDDALLPKDAILDYNSRSGFISFKDGMALFVNMPDPSQPSQKRMPYPNEWLEDGRILTWFIRKNDWGNGNSDTAKLLLSGSNNNSTSSSSVILFVRIGVSDFVCCGSCTASVADNPANNNKLVKLNLHLNNWETIRDRTSFSQLLGAKTKFLNGSSGQEEDNTNIIVQTVLDGNIIGAILMALDKANVNLADRSTANGKSCIKTLLLKSDNPLAPEALEI